MQEANAPLDLDIDESYTLEISPDKGTDILAKITAPTQVGAIYALETLSQLIKFDADSHQYYASTSCTVKDRPRFRHRGVLIDS